MLTTTRALRLISMAYITNAYDSYFSLFMFMFLDLSEGHLISFISWTLSENFVKVFIYCNGMYIVLIKICTFKTLHSSLFMISSDLGLKIPWQRSIASPVHLNQITKNDIKFNCKLKKFSPRDSLVTNHKIFQVSSRFSVFIMDKITKNYIGPRISSYELISRSVLLPILCLRSTNSVFILTEFNR